MGEINVAHDISHGLRANHQLKTDGLRRRHTIQRAQATSGIVASETIEYKRKEIEALDRRIASRIRLMKIMANLNPIDDPEIAEKLDAISEEVLALDD